jgi:hypothetical protein
MSRTAIRLTAVVAALAAAALVAALLASAGGAQQPGERTFKLIAVDEGKAFGDVAPRSRNRQNPRASGGDLLVQTATLFDEANKRVGKAYLQCIAVRGGRMSDQATFQCGGTFVLGDGTLAVNALFPADQPEVLSFPVTGGTGAYEGVAGSMAQHDLARGRIGVTVHLLP